MKFFFTIVFLRDEKRKSPDMTRLQKTVDNSAKTLEILMQNSNSDARTLSGFNTTMQSLKTSMTGTDSFIIGCFYFLYRGMSFSMLLSHLMGKKFNIFGRKFGKVIGRILGETNIF